MPFFRQRLLQQRKEKNHGTVSSCIARLPYLFSDKLRLRNYSCSISIGYDADQMESMADPKGGDVTSIQRLGPRAKRITMRRASQDAEIL